jgi:hypothetical protein
LRGREEIKASVKGQIGEEVTIDSTTERELESSPSSRYTIGKSDFLMEEVSQTLARLDKALLASIDQPQSGSLVSTRCRRRFAFAKAGVSAKT